MSNKFKDKKRKGASKKIVCKKFNIEREEFVVYISITLLKISRIRQKSQSF